MQAGKERERERDRDGQADGEREGDRQRERERERESKREVEREKEARSFKLKKGLKMPSSFLKHLLHSGKVKPSEGAQPHG